MMRLTIQRYGAIVGDVVVFVVSLWCTLFIRFGESPSWTVFLEHLAPFSILFSVWLVVYVMYELYDTKVIVVRRKRLAALIRAQTTNVVIAALFFFLIPYFGITPKTILFIYLIVSLVLIALWRLWVLSLIATPAPQNAILIGSGLEFEELGEYINAHPQFGLRFAYMFSASEVQHSPHLQEEIRSFVEEARISTVVADTHDDALRELLPILYNLTFLHRRVMFIDSTRLYETVFGRVPLSSLRYGWFLEHVSVGPRPLYTALRRLFDIVVTALLALPTLCVHIVVAIAIRLDDNGPVFFIQERMGKDAKTFRLYKYRSMDTTKPEVVTRVGKWLRAYRIDELPQLWNVFRGDLSLIGPRPELPHLVAEYARTIPYYHARHIITPGLSGWAQINEYNVPRRALVEVDKTATKLSYDLYYIKHRSFFLDLAIAIKTVRTLLSRSGN